MAPAATDLPGPPTPSPARPVTSANPSPSSARPIAATLAFEGAPVAIEGRFGHPVSQEVRLIGPRADQVRPTVVRVEGTEVTATPLAAEGGRAPGVRLTLSGKQAGQGVGNVVVSTGLPAPKELVLYYGWKVPGNLTVTPSNPYFDLRLPGRHVVDLSVTSTRPDFRLLRAQVVSGPFAAQIAPPAVAGHIGGAARAVEVRVIESGLTDRRGYLGKLILWSNDSAEPRKEIPLFALGAGSADVTSPKTPSPDVQRDIDHTHERPAATKE